MNKRTLVIINTLSLAIMLFSNYAFNMAWFNTATVADVSHKYDTLFAPAGYAFAIWGLIFLLCTGFVGYQWSLLMHHDTKHFILRTSLWFTVTNIANASWLYCWTNELIGWSVVLILILLITLCILTLQLRLELDDEPALVIFFVWWPVVIYLGWIMVATIACIAAFLTSSGWHGGSLGQAGWTIILIIIASILYAALTINRNMREAAGVGAWAFIAIAVRQCNSHHTIAVVAMMSALVLLILSGLHGYQNRHLSLGAKLKKHQWQ